MASSDLRFDNLPRSMQMLIFAALVGCAAFMFYTHHLKDLLAELGVIQTEIARLELSVSKETAIESQLEFSKKELVHLKKRFEALKSILSIQKETPEVLRIVHQMAAASNLKINKLTPEPVIRRSFCLDWPIRIEVTGNYDGLGLFFEKISRATKAINVAAISIKASDNPVNTAQTLTAGFTLTFFILEEELPQTLEDNEAPKNVLTENRGAIQR